MKESKEPKTFSSHAIKIFLNVSKTDYRLHHLCDLLKFKVFSIKLKLKNSQLFYTVSFAVHSALLMFVIVSC